MTYQNVIPQITGIKEPAIIAYAAPARKYLAGMTNRNTLSVVGTDSGFSNSKAGQAFNLPNGSGFYSGGVTTPTTSYTIAAYMRVTGSDAWTDILSFRSIANGSRIAFVHASTGADCRVYHGGSSALHSGAWTEISDGLWHWVIITWDGTTSRIYIDGALFSSGALTATPSSASTDNFLIYTTSYSSAATDTYGSVKSVYALTRCMPSAEARYRSSVGAWDIFQFQKNMNVFPTASGGSFQPAWAMNSTLTQGINGIAAA